MKKFTLKFWRPLKVRVESLVRPLYRWVWSVKFQSWGLKTPFGKSKATVWPNGTWHTWDSDGGGLENSIAEACEFMPFEDRHHAAKREAWESCERQQLI